MRLDDRLVILLVSPGVNQVEVFEHGAAIRHHGARLLAGFVEPTLGIHRLYKLAILEDVEHCQFIVVIWIGILRVLLANKRIRPNGHRVLIPKLALRGLVEGGAGKTDADHDYAIVDDISPVSPRIPSRQLHSRGWETQPGVALYHASSAIELRCDRRKDE